MVNEIEADDEPGWLRLELLSGNTDLDAARLGQLGALGIEVQDDNTYMEGAEFASTPAGKARLIAFFEEDQSPEELRQAVEDEVDGVTIVSVAVYRDRSWETAWMKYFEATELSPRSTVGPPWDLPEPPVDADGNPGVAIVIEPGMAFGTGTHETTRLCARRLDEMMASHTVETVLDVGCGSAILSMLAAGLGARRVVGIDIDRTAVKVARENTAKNGFSDEEISLSTDPVDQVAGTFDLVVANILAPILLELRPHLKARVKPGGHLLLSGLTAEQIDELRGAFADDDFRECGAAVEGEWASLEFVRNH